LATAALIALSSAGLFAALATALLASAVLAALLASAVTGVLHFVLWHCFPPCSK
jgi:hypothetical protein